MSPPVGIATSQLRQLIHYHLDNGLVDNANFLAGRLHAMDPRSADSAHLLALTYLRLRRFKAAYDYTQKHGANGRHLGCAYVFAQACLELGRHSEGALALEKARSAFMGKSHWAQHSDTTRRHLPDAPAALVLLAKLWAAQSEPRKAGDCYIEAHKLNPFVWDSFEGLCQIGADLKVENMFHLTEDVPESSDPDAGVHQIYVDEDTRRPLAPQSKFGVNVLTPSQDPFQASRPDLVSDDHDFLLPRKPKAEIQTPIVSDWDTPVANGGMIDDDVTMGGVMTENDDVFGEPPPAPSRRARPGHLFETDRLRQPALRGHGQSISDSIQEESAHNTRKALLGGQKRTNSGYPSQTNTDISSGVRRSNRLLPATGATRATRSTADTAAAVASRNEALRAAKPATGTKGRTGALVGRVVSGNRKVLPPETAEKEKDRRAPSRNGDKIPSAAVPSVTATAPRKPANVPAESQALAERQSMAELLNQLRQLAVGYYAASRYELHEAIQHFRSLPQQQRHTPWVLAQLGRTLYEAGDHHSSEECFTALLKLQPSRIEDMEVYSTVLWHLRQDTALAYLCHVLRDQAFDTPQTWVAIGNAFSLSREHDQAISAFRRATQLDDKFQYAWTLMGHEFIANEAYDASLTSFRKAIAIDRRCYGGWYGLGRSYERMGKLEDAERHYRIAASINPSNSTLLVCIGVVLERLRNKKGALANYTRALELAPLSALARFKKARVLMQLRFFHEALAELEVMRDQCPDEPNVWFLLGKCYKGLGHRGDALRAFTTALNLDPKAAPYIKEAMESLDDDADDSDDD